MDDGTDADSAVLADVHGRTVAALHGEPDIRTSGLLGAPPSEAISDEAEDHVFASVSSPGGHVSVSMTLRKVDRNLRQAADGARRPRCGNTVGDGPPVVVELDEPR